MANDNHIVSAMPGLVHDGLKEEANPLRHIRPALAVWRSRVEFPVVVAQSGPFFEFFGKFPPLFGMVVDFGKETEILLPQQIILPNLRNQLAWQGLKQGILALSRP